MVIVNYLKYELKSDYAELVGYDKRKKEISFIRVPKSINYNNQEYPVLGINDSCLSGLTGRIIEVPNTIIYLRGERIDLTPYTGQEGSQDGWTMKIYEARENPPKKSWWKRIFG